MSTQNSPEQPISEMVRDIVAIALELGFTIQIEGRLRQCMCEDQKHAETGLQIMAVRKIGEKTDRSGLAINLADPEQPITDAYIKQALTALRRHVEQKPKVGDQAGEPMICQPVDTGETE